MRFMVLVKSNADAEAGVLPSEQMLVTMGKFNDGLIKDGMLLAGEGLHASSKGARIKFAAGAKPVVTDGPFAETKELVAGFWMIKAASKEEVVTRFLSCPEDVGEIEIRQVFESPDFEPVIHTDEGRALLRAEDEFRKNAKT